ncbi:MAG TPA: DUF2085 domain-containing protein [Longimicrobium sp.]|jgi:uncharacterized membrane protein
MQGAALRAGQALATRLFVANPYLALWHCHRRCERSFFVRGRQFGVCARCTGLLVGGVLSPLAVPLGAGFLVPAACAATVLLGMDGGSQFAGWRVSSNPIRLLTGLAAGLMGPAAVLALIIS